MGEKDDIVQFPAPLAPTYACPAYYRYGPELPESPIIISVPHAGRHYPASVLGHARVDRDGLERLEDRLADLLVHKLIAAGQNVFVARQARAVIDLNRAENEIDAAMMAESSSRRALLASAKVRGGLGLVPRRLSALGDLWNGPLGWDELERRISEYHRPYHTALHDALHMARDRFGHAILLDMHSMPPLLGANGAPSPRIILGDRFGRSASGRLTGLAVEISRAHGLIAAQNHPYPGNYLLERHGSPANNIHAIQCEIDRSLYLDASFRWPTLGLSCIQRVIMDLVEGLAGELPQGDYAQAAE
ncbi:MAG: N-formylglutamate amidohydrolase [Alphaproteobacteria bacterium]|nr:N-formylglutamate amidohydrolase [Alphaproteobacteria bacterium]